MTAQYTFVMKDLRKLVPPKREILKGIWLSFYPGAKIGVLGNNGAGKSTLLRIMAGVDKEFLGEAWPAPGPQDRLPAAGAAARSDQDVKENVEEGVAETRALLARFEEVSMKLGEDMSDGEDGQAARGAGSAPGSDRGGERVGARPHGRHGDGRAALPARRRRRHQDLRWRAPPRRAVPAAALASPTCCCSTSRPTTSTPRASRGSSGCSRSSRARSSRSRTIATSSTTSRSGSSSSIAARATRSRATTPAGSSSRRSASRTRRSRPDARERMLARELEWVRLSPKARQAKSKARLNRYDEMVAEAQKEARDAVARDRDPAGPAPRRRGRRRSRASPSRSAIAC